MYITYGAADLSEEVGRARGLEMVVEAARAWSYGLLPQPRDIPHSDQTTKCYINIYDIRITDF